MQWPLPKRIAFRFLFVYLLLYCFPIPQLHPVGMQFVPWIARLLGIELVVKFTGSGDTAFHYAQVLCFVAISALAALIWSLADRKRPNYHRLYLWLLVVVRLYLGMIMIHYGAIKVIPSQFSPLQPYSLLQTYGESSPMGLLWKFMGASHAYNVFVGATEMLGGILLFFNRTATLGALLCIGTMGNVVMLNFSYDVPVKLFSLHLLFMAIFVAARDAGRLANVLVWQRPSEPAAVEALTRCGSWQRAGFALRMILLAALTGNSLYSSYGVRLIETKQSVLHGVWEVDEFAQEGEVRPPSVFDQDRWWRLVVFGDEAAFVQLMNNQRVGGYLIVRPKESKLFFRDQEFSYRQPTGDTLEVDGTYQNHTVRVRMHRMEFPLLNRGFRWISEEPFNR